MNIIKIILNKVRASFVKINKEDNVYLSNYFGKKWYINYPQKSMCLWALDFMDTHERFVEIVKKNGIIIEAGACSGEYTLDVASKIGKDGKIYTFEIDNLSFESLEKNIEHYQYKNIFPFKLALSDKDNETLKFNNIPDSMAGGSFHYGEDQGYTVQTITLDTFCKNQKIEKIDILKLTVNDHEAIVLAGTLNMLKKTHYVQAQTKMHKDLIEILKDNNFVILKEIIENEKSDVKNILMENKNWV